MGQYEIQFLAIGRATNEHMGANVRKGEVDTRLRRT